MLNPVTKNNLQEEYLFDAAENFKRALTQDRAGRGEPTHGITRNIWEAGQWVRRNQKAVTGISVVLISIGAGIAFYQLIKADESKNLAQRESA